MAHTDEERQNALVLYLQLGTAGVSRETGIPPRTIRRWANEANLAAARTLVLQEGGVLLAKTHEVMREEVRVLLLEKTLDLLERIDQPHIEYKAAGSELHRLEHPIATSGDVKNYAGSITQLLEKYRLEMGESTGRTETLTLGVIEAEVQRLEAELGKRAPANT